MEPVFRTLELIANGLVRGQGLKLRFFGLENIPRTGGAVLAVNHTAYTDFIPAALGLQKEGRRGRFMIKSEVMDIGIMRFLVHHCKAVPVDRSAGADAYRAAVDSLSSGEVVVVYPETTISRSFELKDFKNGAVRMAAEAGVPVVPCIVWGAQRQMSKGTRRRMGRSGIPVDVMYGPAVHYPADVDADAATVELHTTMDQMLHRVQDGYPEAPPGADWLPARLGGSAPTPDEALVIENAEAAEKARLREERRAAEANQDRDR
ncbi:MAG: lysophospholipid acyltransferase family protein [Gordonia sp. (in: high G+C Gram-positive bacteria)]|uniref:lysophospholipid acyltransferase family protein n=1 Tax=Gordonia sp. (in: high G+C Gram-positive bacteria) TaxID=84139 RepID=UPI0039E3462F